MILADPAGSVLAEYVATGHVGEAGSWLVEGIGEDFVPPIADLSRVRQAFTIGDLESLTTARESAASRGHSSRLLLRHLGGGGTPLLPPANHAENRGDLRLRLGQ